MAKKASERIFNSSVTKMILALTAVGVISGITLVFVYDYAMPKILVNIKTATDQAIKNIFPDAVRIEASTEDNVYEVMNAEDEVTGYAFLAEGNGYQGIIKLIVGADAGLTTIKGMEVLESQETPGLGAEIADEGFKGQFKGLAVTHPVEYVKNKKPQKDYQIEAITGATISSRAVVNILNKRIKQLRGVLKK